MTKEETETREQLKEASRVHTEWQTLSTQAKAIPEVHTSWTTIVIHCRDEEGYGGKPRCRFT